MNLEKQNIQQVIHNQTKLKQESKVTLSLTPPTFNHLMYPVLNVQIHRFPHQAPPPRKDSPLSLVTML